MEIVRPISHEQIQACRDLFTEYHRSIGVDLSYQGFAEELENLPGAYSHPSGSLFLATDGDDPVGCIAMRRLNDKSAEMKRLYVIPRARKEGTGRELCECLMEDAMEMGYETVFLDTPPFMQGAIALYESLGFTRCPAYYETPLEETVFMRLHLPKRLST